MSASRGAWTCVHGVDGRDWCEDCHGGDAHEKLVGAIAQMLYETSNDFDPRMPKVWQRGFMTRSGIYERADKLARLVEAVVA